MTQSNERKEAIMATSWNLNRKSDEGGAKIKECITERRSTYKCVRQRRRTAVWGALWLRKVRNALNRRRRSAWFLSPLQSLDPDEYDKKKIPHTAALKRVTKSTRQKGAKKKLTNLGEDIWEVVQSQARYWSGNARATTRFMRSSMVGGAKFDQKPIAGYDNALV